MFFIFINSLTQIVAVGMNKLTDNLAALWFYL